MTEQQALQRIEPEQAQAELPAIVTVEPKTSQQARIDEVTEALLPAYQKASELRLSDEENNALLAPFADDQVEIRPHDGLLYIPHIHISDRLIRVLGAGQWAMVRRREWIEGNRIYAEYVMKVRGCFVGESVGAMDYHPSNARMNYSDALEGTRGECIRRIAAKDLGCGSQVWNPEYCRQWVAKYAEKIKGEWKRKGQGNGQNRLSDKPANVPQNVPRSQKPVVPEVATEEQRLRWIAELKLRGEWALGYCYDKAWLMPESGPDDDRTPAEPLESLEARHVPTTRKAADAILAELDSLIPADQRPKPAGASRPPSESGGQASGASQGNVTPKNTVLRHSEPDQQPWYAAVVPVPYKGMKRDQYLKKPDTIGELYNLRHDDDQARRRLFGFVHNFEPKGWTNREGKEMPPSKADIQFRNDLDAFADWFQENHPDESND